ncbi:MAG: DNA mismatch repair protein MutS, partial [bacterium]
LLPGIRDLLKNSESEMLSQMAGQIPDLKTLSDLVSEAILDDAPSVFKPGCVIDPQYDSRLAEIQKKSEEGKKWILELQEAERKRTGIPNLKVGYNQVFGYYIEVTRSYLKNVPSDYIRKQTLVGAERFVTDELKRKENEILRAEEMAERLEEEIFREIRSRIASEVAQIQLAARLIGELDVLASFADISYSNNYVRPVMKEEIGIEIHDGRHPVVEHFLGVDQFIPNDIVVDPDNQILIITGPNMAGKSTFIRQVALIVIMAQTGCFVPASSAKIGIVDKIFTRIGAADRVARGQSTFLVEMIETAKILSNATSRSLVLLDEVGRGTSTFDGLSIAWAVVEYLHENKRSRPLTLFATHYHELTDLEKILPRVRNFNILVRECGDQIVFLRKIARGASDRSYGIQVAKLAGLPFEVVERAKEILRNLEEDEYSVGDVPRIARGQYSHIPKDIQLTLWDTEKQIASYVKQIDIDNLTPIEAMQELARLKKLAIGKEGNQDGKDKGSSR